MQFQVIISKGDIPLRLFGDCWIEAAEWANKELDVPWYIQDTETGDLVWESSHHKKLYVSEVFKDGRWVPNAFHTIDDIRDFLSSWVCRRWNIRTRRVKTRQEACELGDQPDFINLDLMEWVK